MTNSKTVKRIESPLSAFNNIMIDISKQLELIYLDESNKNINFINNLIFENNTITICGCVKVVYIDKDKKFGLKFLGCYDSNNIDIVQKSITNIDKLFGILQYYMFMISTFGGNIDLSVSQAFIDSIYESVLRKENKNYLIPFKNKIKHLYDKNDGTLDNLYNRFSYMITFINNGNRIKYSLKRVLSSELNESKCLDNIRFEDCEVIVSNTIDSDNLQKFLIDLFYYGIIPDNINKK